MKTICLLIFLALAGTAWGMDKECKTYHTDDQWYTHCVPKVEKGHCPHCGAKFTLEGLELYWPNRGDKYYTSRVGMIYFCPHGHLFWEKD